MDIAKYIGLFLLKNNFCYVHGLGNLVLHKKPATYEGNALKAPAYEVQVSPGGSIDDSLANFIATNEHISISKAANALREFSTQAKADLHEGKEVIIPSLGKFVEQNGTIQFITDPHLQYTPPAIPTVKNVAKEKKEEYEAKMETAAHLTDVSDTSIKWGRVLLIAGVVALLVIAVIYGKNYIDSKEDAEAVTPTEEVDTPALATPVPVATDTATNIYDSARMTEPNEPAPVVDGVINMKVIINEYNNRSSADSRAKKLTSYGNSVEVAAIDSNTYYVVMPITAAVADTAHVLDSLRRTFNPKGVRVHHSIPYH